uniref:Uncharacterized protein n=1 Tax=Gopherus agassizii TaxID=38772 RepID=A0A452GM09_9SAUR
MEELQSVTAEQMRLPPFRVVEGINYDFFIICCAVAFSPLIYFMSLNVAKERRKFKELMKMMALQDFAFWCVKCPLNYVCSQIKLRAFSLSGHSVALALSSVQAKQSFHRS